MIVDHGFRHLAQQADATPRMRLDDLGAGPVDVVTMDVEGAELEVLRGATILLLEHRPVVFVSIHPEFMRELYEVEDFDLHTYMSGLGYQSCHIATDHEQHWAYYHPDNAERLPSGWL